MRPFHEVRKQKDLILELIKLTETALLKAILQASSDAGIADSVVFGTAPEL